MHVRGITLLKPSTIGPGMHSADSRGQANKVKTKVIGFFFDKSA
jgi:hypothetical protein